MDSASEFWNTYTHPALFEHFVNIMLFPLHCLYLCNHIINFNHLHAARKGHSMYWDTLLYIFAHLHRNSIQLSIPYPRPISLDSNVKGAFDVNHHSDNWPNCSGHYWNCNYPWPWCGNETVSITSSLLFVLFSKRLPWHIDQHFP